MTLGKTTPKKIDPKLVKCVVKEMKLSAKKQEQEAKQSPRKKSCRKPKLKLTAQRVLSKNHKMLGKMDVDARFLENFLKQQSWRAVQTTNDESGEAEQAGNGNSNPEFVNILATDALNYLEDRKHFWEQTAAAKAK